MPLALRVLAAAGAVVLTVSILWAMPQADIFQAFAEVARNPWGLVGLIDLYLGFVLFAIVIVGYEPSRAAGIAWVVALFILGNLVAAVWLLWRHRQLWTALKAAHRI